MKRFTISAAMLAALLMVSSAQAQVVTWVGGAGQWDLGASWDNGLIVGSANSILGRSDGWRETDGLVADPIITISDASSDVLYDAEFLGDFGLRSDNGGTGLLKIEAGATLELHSGATPIGRWTLIDAKGIIVTGAGSELSRTTSVAGNNAGAFIFGSSQNDPGEIIDIQVLDFAKLHNEGQIWFGAYNDSAPDINVTLEIGRGAKVNTQGALQGGVSLNNTAGAEGEINFIYNWDPAANSGLGATDDSTYAIDFATNGSGSHGGTLSVPVGTTGIRVQEETSPGVWTSTQKSYTDLWDDGLLLFAGLDKAGHGGVPIGTFFTVGTSLFAPITAEGVEPPMFSILTSIAGAVDGGSNPGDFNGDFTVNAIDASIMFANWNTSSPHVHNPKTVSEGNLTVGGDDDINAVDAAVMFAGWSFPDPGPAAAGTAIADYDPLTGEIIISIEGVNNWFVQSASGSLTGDEPSFTPIIPGSLLSNDNNLIGETGFATASGTDVSLGNVAAPGLGPFDLKIFWNAGLGSPTQWTYICGLCPEPTTLTLAALGLCGVLATRRRHIA